MNEISRIIKEEIQSMGEYLYNYQVIAEDISCSLKAGEQASLQYYFIRKNPGPYAFTVKREDDILLVNTGEGENSFLQVKEGQFFRLYPGHKIKNPANGEGGITYQFNGFCSGNNNELKLMAYDRGGIFDELVNMEAFLFEPQVAGTYYADAYSAYAFGWMADNGYGDHYLEASKDALDFIRRIYPCYEATYLDGMPHCDFKNPAYIETVEEFMVGKSEDEEIARWRSLYDEMIPNEEYSPTNVYALRYHWWSLLNHYLEKIQGAKSSYDPHSLLRRLKQDQTVDGLIQDNNYSEISFGGYNDAHDLTYHLYALSWLARGYDYLPLEEVWSILEKGALFSLSMTTPGGEASYLGRSANNIYHLVSSIYVYLKVAFHSENLAPQFFRAVRLILDYIRPFRLSEGNYPVGLNSYPEELIGWSHCQTPYNGTNAYFLIRSLSLVPDDWQEEPLELEKENLLIYPDSRLAAQSNEHFYYVIFSGSDISPYPHSGVHNTGVAGLAMLGLQGCQTMLPVLEQSLREGEWSTSDLPDLELPDSTIEVPINRGKIRRDKEGHPEIEISYSGLRFTQTYIMEEELLRISTILYAHDAFKGRLIGAPGLSLRCDKGYSYELNLNGFSYFTPHGSLFLNVTKTALGDGKWEVMEPSSTGKGYHQKVAWCSNLELKNGEEKHYEVTIRLSK